MGRLKRTFLGWDRPLLALLRDHLLHHYVAQPCSHFAPGVVDLSSCVVVLPGRRAGRRLIELLLGSCPGGGLLPPRITTPENLWSVVGGSVALRAASSTDEHLAWIAALRELPESSRAALVRLAPDGHEIHRWSALADLIGQARQDLVSAGRCLSDMPRQVADVAGDEEAARWDAVAQAESLFMQTLSKAGLHDRASWRAHVADSLRGEHGEDHHPPRIIVAGVVELTTDACRLLGSLAEHTEIVVFAPPDSSPGFDDCGRVLPEWWTTRPIPIDDSRILTTQTIQEQADRTLAEITSRAGGRAADQVAIGVPDPNVAEALLLRAAREMESSSSEVPRLRLAAGRPLASTSPHAFLVAARDFIATRTFEGFAALIRHTQVSAFIDQRVRPRSALDEWMNVLDEYHAQHVHWRVDGAWNTSDPREGETLAAVHEAVRYLLGETLPTDPYATPGHIPLGSVLDTVAEALRRLYGGALVGRPTSWAVDAANLLSDAITELAQAARRITPGLGGTPESAIDFVLARVAELAVPDDGQESAIELLGWLELAMDDAPVLIVTGMNNDVIPAPSSAEPLLPNSLRGRLGLPTRESRRARDAWIMSALVRMRPDAVFVCAKRGARHEARLPSPLLLADDPMTIARRLRRWTSPAHAPDRTARRAVPPTSTSRSAPVSIARPLDLSGYTPLTSMSVTSFRDYLASPYLFYLRHIARLREMDPSPAEMDALHFGTLVHDVMHQLAGSDAARSDDPEKVARFLHATLDAAAHQRFGNDPMPAIWMQLQQAHARLDALAHWQARRAREGWRIAYTEWQAAAGSVGGQLVVDGIPMGLRGRIDRIDVNDDLGSAIIFDYKTSDKAADERTLRTADGEWLDLQLPLYRHLVRSLDLPPDIQLGFVRIPRHLNEVGDLVIKLSADDLASADEAAASVIRGIRRQEFADLGPRPPVDGLLARICGTTYLPVEDDEEDETP
ncbi:MAG: PD-(D/E)XK nuclease family protein [Phycisphaerales bacterium]